MIQLQILHLRLEHLLCWIWKTVSIKHLSSKIRTIFLQKPCKTFSCKLRWQQLNLAIFLINYIVWRFGLTNAVIPNIQKHISISDNLTKSMGGNGHTTLPFGSSISDGMWEVQKIECLRNTAWACNQYWCPASNMKMFHFCNDWTGIT